MEGKTAPAWRRNLDPREQAQIAHARNYAQTFASAGVPGHGLHMLIAKMADLLDQKEAGITAAGAPTESISDAIGAIEDLAELLGWPSIDTDQAEDNFQIIFKRGGL